MKISALAGLVSLPTGLLAIGLLATGLFPTRAIAARPVRSAAPTTAPSASAPPAPAPPAIGAEGLTHYINGSMLEQSGDLDGALREYYRALADDPTSITVIRHIAELTAQTGDAARSLEFARRGLKTAPDDARLLWLEGAALFNLGKAEEALVPLQAAVRADSEETAYSRTLARVAEQLGRNQILADAWRHVTDIDEEDGEAWFQRASAEARLGRFDDADKSLQSAKDLVPDRPGTLFLEGWIRENQGRRGEAIQRFQQHLAVHDDPMVRRRLVQLLVREHRWDEAWREAQKVARSQPDDYLATEIEVDLAFRASRPSAAMERVPRLRELAGSDPEKTLRIVALLARNKRPKDALAVADAWAATAPVPTGDMVAAQARSLTGDNKAAIARVRRGVAAAPDSLAPRVLLASLLQSDHQYAAAESTWFGSLPHGADTLETLLQVALCREDGGNIAGAEQAVRDALRRDPNNPRTLNFLGYLMADHNVRLDEALNLIQQAVKLDPDNGAYVDSLGWVYYRLGRFDEARAELERAVHLTDGDPVVHEHLGDVYKQLKLNDLAKEQYRLSLAADAGNAKVRAKLDSLR